MNDALLFQVPIYRTSPEEWRTHVEGLIEDYMRRYLGSNPGASIESRQHHRGIAWSLATDGVPRDYNDVVAWIEVIWDGPGPAIKAFASATDQRVIRRGFSPKYVLDPSSVFEGRFRLGQTSNEIAAEVRDGLGGLTRPGGRFARRWIDLRAFDSISPSLDWERLIGLGP